MKRNIKILIAIFSVLIVCALVVGIVAIVPRNKDGEEPAELKEYVISYNSNGGRGNIAKENVKEKQSVTLSSGENFSRDGYTLISWNTKMDGSGDSYSLGGTISKYNLGKNITLYALWRANQYTIKYNVNGGTGTVADQIFTFGSFDGTNNGEGISKEGYALYSWNTKPDGSGTDVFPTMPYYEASDVTLYAIWKREVRYDVNGAVNIVASQYVFDGQTFELLPKESCRKPGYSLSKWKDKDTGELYDIGQEITFNYDRPLNLMAVWEEVTYKIRYYDKGGVAFSGEELLLPTEYRYFDSTTLVSPTKAGFTFVGWFKEKDCSGEKVTELKAEEYDDEIVLYALWQKDA